jgi:uncharacterized protein
MTGEGPVAPLAERGRAFAFFLIAVVLGFGGTVGVAEAKRPVRSLAEIRYQDVVMQKWDMSCGSAALATLLTYDLGDPVGERAVATTMLRRTDPLKVRVRGFSFLDLQQYAEQRGYEADGYGKLSFSDLISLLPAIVPVEFQRSDHFIVVRRVLDGEVHFADPAFGRRTLPIATFERVWVQKVAFTVHRG